MAAVNAYSFCLMNRVSRVRTGGGVQAVSQEEGRGEEGGGKDPGGEKSLLKCQ